MKVNQRQHAEVEGYIKRKSVITHETIRLGPYGLFFDHVTVELSSESTKGLRGFILFYSFLFFFIVSYYSHRFKKMLDTLCMFS